jgi:hypothetical protein
METFGGVLTAFLIAAIPLGLTVTKVVDFVRNLLGDAQANVPKWVWNVLAFVVGIIIALAFEINLIAPVVAAIPALKDWSPDSTLAMVLSGIGLGAVGSGWHEKLDQWSSNAKANKPVAS